MRGQSQPSARWRLRRASPHLLLPVISGILAWASFPKINQGYLAWICLVPLILFVTREITPGRAFLAGMIAGITQFLGLLYWIPRVLTNYGGLPSFGAWGLYLLMVAILACYPATACALTRSCMNRCGSWGLLTFAPAWVALEYLRGTFPCGGLPWMLIGYSQTEYLRLIQIADIAGVYGVSFLIVWINTALAWTLLRRKHSSLVVVSGLVLLSACSAYGSWRLQRWDRTEPDYRAALLQGNLSIDMPESELAWRYQQGYVRMADEVAAERADLLILPESPSPVFYQYDSGYRETMRGLAHRFPFGLVFNNVAFDDAEGKTAYYNAAFFLRQNGTEAGRYDKIHLVPFGEYVPWQKLFFFIEAISKDVGNFRPGTRYLTVPLDGHPVNAIICFEAVFPDISREFARRGSQLFINLTNDGWYGDTAAPYQHLAMARWRAVECRRYLLRAANSGISAIVAPSGRIQVRTRLLREDMAAGGFAFLSGETFFVRLGGAFPILCVIITCFALLWSRLRGTRPPVAPAIT